MSDRAIVEAALYSSGKPLSVDDLVRVTGLEESAVREHLKALSREYDRRGSAIEIVPIGTRWTMQIRPEYAERARPFAPPELDRELLKTAALIAYHQPILQSELHDMVGEKVYEHTKALEDLRLITRKPSGRSFELATTRYFAEFFGLKTTSREGIRRIMAERAGIPYREKPESGKGLGEGAPEALGPEAGGPTPPPEGAAESPAITTG